MGVWKHASQRMDIEIWKHATNGVTGVNEVNEMNEVNKVNECEWMWMNVNECEKSK